MKARYSQCLWLLMTTAFGFSTAMAANAQTVATSTAAISRLTLSGDPGVPLDVPYTQGNAAVAEVWLKPGSIYATHIVDSASEEAMFYGFLSALSVGKSVSITGPYTAGCTFGVYSQIDNAKY